MSRSAARLLRASALFAVVTAVVPAMIASAGTLPPPTPVPPHGSLSPFPTALATPPRSLSAPEVSAPVALLADVDTGQVMFAKAPLAPRPIASVTKIMTALLVLERGHLGDIVTVSPDAVFTKNDYGASSTLGLRAGEQLSVRDLLYATMLESANDAAVALAIHVSGSASAFVALMNRRAVALHMHDTRYFSPNGLDDRGHSTAHDLLLLTRAAYRTPGFSRIVGTKFRAIPAPEGPPRRIQNRNVLLWLYPGAIGVKTGSTAAARYCLVAAAQRDGRRLVAVILGAPSDAFSDAARLLNYGFDAFRSATFAERGRPAGELSIRGGIVPTIAGDTIAGLIPADAADDVRRTRIADPNAAFPPTPGERVGILRVTIPGVTLGVVPLLAAALPPPRPQNDDPWWMRSGSTVLHAIAHAVSGLF